jgi:hypothetical protein
VHAGHALGSAVSGSLGFRHRTAPHQVVGGAGQPGRQFGPLLDPCPYASDQAGPARQCAAASGYG